MNDKRYYYLQKTEKNWRFGKEDRLESLGIEKQIRYSENHF